MLTVELPLAGIEVWVPGLIALGIFIGFLTGLFGVGGGFLLTPFLRILFNVPYPVAVGSGLAQMLITASLSAWRHWQARNTDPKLGTIMAVGALAGTEVGVRLLRILDTGGAIVLNSREFPVIDMVMPVIFLILMVAIAVTILKETSGQQGSQEVVTPACRYFRSLRMQPLLSFEKSGIASMPLWIPLFLSCSVGVLTGLLGIGGGFVNFPLLVYALGVPTHLAVGTSAFQILFATAYGALRHALAHHVDLALALAILVGSIAGVQLGVRVCHVLGGRRIRRYFAFVILLGVVVILAGLLGDVLG